MRGCPLIYWREKIRRWIVRMFRIKSYAEEKKYHYRNKKWFFSDDFPTFFNFDFKVKVEKSWGKSQSWKKFICRPLIPIVARSKSLKSWGKNQSYSTLTLTGHRLTLTCSIDTKVQCFHSRVKAHAHMHRQEQVRGKLKSCPPIPLPSLSLISSFPPKLPMVGGFDDRYHLFLYVDRRT